MAASPVWKIYNAEGEYIGSAKYAETAAVMLTIENDGATIRYGHNIVCYTKGTDGDPGESYDTVTNLCQLRRSNYINRAR